MVLVEAIFISSQGSAIPFLGLELVEGRQGQIPSRRCLAQWAGPTLSLQQKIAQLENRPEPALLWSVINELSLGNYTTSDVLNKC